MLSVVTASAEVFAYCTTGESVSTTVMERMVQDGWQVIPIVSQEVYTQDTRFGTAQENLEKITAICGRQPLHTLQAVEPIGPKDLLDVLIIAPCTGSTLARLAHGISDTPVSLAAKSQLRVEKPVVLAVASNDALAGSAPNIAALLNRKQYYFTPMRQDAPQIKPRSLVADMNKIPETAALALAGKQIQPIFC